MERPAISDLFETLRHPNMSERKSCSLSERPMACSQLGFYESCLRPLPSARPKRAAVGQSLHIHRQDQMNRHAAAVQGMQVHEEDGVFEQQVQLHIPWQSRPRLSTMPYQCLHTEAVETRSHMSYNSSSGGSCVRNQQKGTGSYQFQPSCLLLLRAA